MDLSKRGFLQALSTAPMAVPAAVQALTQAVSNMGINNLPTSDATLGLAPSIPGSWMKEELKNLIRRRKEISVPKASDRLNGMQLGIAYAGSLRSISHVNALRMAAERAAAIETAREVYWIDKHVAEYKAQLGPLASILD